MSATGIENTALASFRNPFAPARGFAVMALALGLLAGPLTASATTVFNITGVGCVSDYFLMQDGSIASGCFGAIDQGYSMTGTVALDVYGAAEG